jgi:thiol-disulfide isomerase/thioredoxin
MRRVKLIFLIGLSWNNQIPAQCILTIHQQGIPTDTIFLANYEEDKQPQRINDSTYRLIWNTLPPERLCLVLDRATRWWTTIWIEPSIKEKEITIDYSKKEMRLTKGSEWDIVSQKWMGPFPYHGNKSRDSIAELYVEKNPDSYLSLFFLAHGAYLDKPQKRKMALDKLPPILKTYPEYRQVLAGFKKRKYPNIGDAFKEFQLTDMQGKIFNSKEIKDRWILLNFWSNGCGPCVKEIDDFVKLYNASDRSKVEFISIALDEDEGKWRVAKASPKIPWISLWTPDNTYCELCLNYNLYSIPFFILFDNEKKLFFIKDGAGELENIKSVFREKGLLNRQ